MWLDVDHRRNGKAEPVMQRVLYFVGRVVADLDGEIGIDRNRRRDV